jgi:hypothetical protein
MRFGRGFSAQNMRNFRSFYVAWPIHQTESGEPQIQGRGAAVPIRQTVSGELIAHAHVGNLVLDHRPEDALGHCGVGFRIGELPLGLDCDSLLPWGLLDNRPFLRCMHGLGLRLWRLGRFKEAVRVFDRMLWLNPADNLGVRFLNDDVRSRTAWRESP